jgi:hypothetical protein
MENSGWDRPGPDPERTAVLPVRRRRRRGRRWLIALVVLLALLVGLDRIGLAVAENQLAGRIQSSQHLSQKPSVSIDGFPFLTQVAQRHFGHATVDIHDLDANGLTISDLHTDLYGVHVNGAFNGAEVDTLKADAVIDYTSIAAAVSKYMTIGGVQLGTATITPAGNGELTASFSAPSEITDLIGGTGLIKLNIHVTLDGPNILELRSDKISSSLADIGFNPDFDTKFDLSTLPFGVKLTSLTYTATAVQIAAEGNHVNLTQSGLSGG